MTYWQAEEFLGGNSVYALHCKGHKHIIRQWNNANKAGETKKADALMALSRQYRHVIMPSGEVIIKLVIPIM